MYIDSTDKQASMDESISSAEINKVEKIEPLQKGDGEDDIKPQVKTYEEK